MSNYDYLPTEAINEQISQIENVIGNSSGEPEKAREAESARDDQRRSGNASTGGQPRRMAETQLCRQA
jgi:hypothetical protein